MNPPTNLQVRSVTATTATLSWDGASPGVKFEIEVSPGSISDGNAVSPYLLTPLSPATSHTWRIRATKGNSSSAWVQGPAFTTSNTGVSDVQRLDSGVPEKFQLSQNYPNPFNPTTNIEFSIPRSAHLSIAIYNALGIRVSTLADAHYGAGRYLATWDASSFPSGVYFCRIQTPGFVDTKRLVLLK
jgi:hypothetical protein